MTLDQSIGGCDAGYTWRTGHDDGDGWISKTATMEVHGATRLVLDIWLPDHPETKRTKLIQVLCDGGLICAVEAIRGQNTLAEISLPTPARSGQTLQILSEYRDAIEGDPRELGFYCNAVTVEPLDERGRSMDDEQAAGENADPRTTYFVFPDYRATNPYQTMIERFLPDTYEVVYTDIDGAIDHLVSRPPHRRRVSVFHLHWATFVLAHAQNEPDAERRVLAFLTRLDAFIKLGGIVIWTVHNTIPHDAKFKDAETALNQGIADRAHLVHIHALSALPQIEEHFTIARDKIREIAHPSYVGVYPDYVSKETARRALKIDPDLPTFLFLGQLRPYKGLSQFVASAKALADEGHEFHVVIAGKPFHPFATNTVTQMTRSLGRVTVVEEFVRNEDLQLYYRAADVAVFPYMSILTSGSVLGALSFDTPVIAPDFPAIADVLDEGETGWLFDRTTPAALTSAMERALAAQDRWGEMSKAAGTLAARLTWQDFAMSLDAAIASVAQNKRTIDVNGTERALVPILPAQSTNTIESTGIVILTDHQWDDLKRVLASLSTSTDMDFRVYVVDNRSTDLFDYQFRALLTQYDFPIEVYRTEENLGCGAGNNIGITIASAAGHDFIWVLSPDAEVEGTTFDTLRSYAQATPEAKVIGPKILHNRKSRVVRSSGGVVKFEGGTRVEHLYGGMPEAAVPARAYTVEFLDGASLFCRAEVFQKIALMPEHYFHFFEDMDWCLAIRRQLGDALWVCPSAVLYHDKPAVTDGPPAEDALYYFVRNLVAFTCAYAPEPIKDAAAAHNAAFVDVWLDQIKRRSPSRHSAYMQSALSARVDGLAGETGRKLSYTAPAGDTGAIYRGDLSTRDSGKITGTLKREDRDQEPCSGIVMIDGRPIAMVGDPTQPSCGRPVEFDVSATAYLCDGLPHTVGLVSSNGHIVAEQIYYVPHDLEYRGRIDGVRDMTLRGWAVNNTNFNEEVVVDAYAGDQFLASGIANMHRADLRTAEIGRGDNAFQIRLPASILDGARRTITIKLAATGEVLHTREVDCTAPARNPEGASLAEKEAWLYAHREARYIESDTLIASYLAARAAAPKLPTRDTLPMVSVVMPAFNREDTIAEAMASVFRQAYPKVELIVVDDGSADDTLALAEQAASQSDHVRRRVIALSEHSGTSHARNVALDAASGEIIAYLDPGNTWQANYLSIMVWRLLASNAKTAYCAQLIHQMRNDRHGMVAEPVIVRGGAFSLAQIENRSFIDLDSFVHRRDLFERFGGFNENMTRLMDWELILRYCRAARPIYVRALLVDNFTEISATQAARSEDHGLDMSVLENTIESGAPFVAAAPEENGQSAHVIVPIWQEGPDLDTLVERAQGLEHVAQISLLCVGDDAAAWWGALPPERQQGFTAHQVAKTDSLATALAKVAAHDAAVTVMSMPGTVFGRKSLAHLADGVLGQAQSALVAATHLGDVNAHLRQSYSFAQRPLSYPSQPRSYAHQSPVDQPYLYHADAIEAPCFAMRTQALQNLLETIETASDWQGLCDQLAVNIGQIAGRVLVDERARVRTI